ncbi:MAG: branched-chain amino acid ABC transporter substrate-binding protein [Anaerolineae bacterium]|nr:MAG: branched-chain amino acid ABC transporter substrate-binding protein [Anaerolineae bacterium]
MSKRFVSIFSLLVIASMALAACGGGAAPLECTDAIGCVEVAAGEPIHLAYMLTVSGATATLGDDSLGGIRVALNDRPDVLGHTVELTGEDEGCSAEGGQTAGTKVAADPSVVAIVGTNCSGAAFAALPAISEAGMLMCSSSNTNPGLTDPEGGWLPGYYRTAHNDKFQGRIAAEFAYNELGARTAATIHDGSPYAQALQQVFAETFAALGGTVTFQGAVNVGDTDMRAVLTTVAADTPDILYYPIFEPEGNFITAQAAEVAGMENTILMGADGLLADTFPENSGENVVGMYLSGPYVTGATYDDFLAKWAEVIGGVPPSGFHAFAYDCTNMILDAIESVAQQGSDGTLLIGRQALRDAMTATAGFDGLTGSLTCNEYGDCATGEALAVFQITEAELNGGWPPAAIWTP